MLSDMRPKRPPEEPPVLTVPLGLLEHMLFGVMPNMKQGTYNEQDPTAYRRAEGYVVVDDYGPAGSHIYHVRLSDVTWGTDLHVEEVILDHRRPRCNRLKLAYYHDHGPGPKVTWYAGKEHRVSIISMLLDGRWFSSLDRALKATFPEWGNEDWERLPGNIFGYVWGGFRRPIPVERVRYGRTRRLP